MLDGITMAAARRAAAPRLLHAADNAGIARTFLLPQPEEARSIPVRAGDQPGDLGEARVGLSRIGEPALCDNHAMSGAGPFPDEFGTGLDPAPAQGGQHRRWILGLGQAVEQPLGRSIEATERFDLQLIGERPEQEIALEAGRSRRSHLPLPVRPQLLEAEIAQPRDLAFDPHEIRHGQAICWPAGAERTSARIRYTVLPFGLLPLSMA